MNQPRNTQLPFHSINIEECGGLVLTMRKLDVVSLHLPSGDVVVVGLSSIKSNEARVVFDAPESVRIARHARKKVLEQDT